MNMSQTAEFNQTPANFSPVKDERQTIKLAHD